MDFLSLTYETQVYILALVIISFIVLLIGLSVNIAAKRNKSTILILSILSVIAIIENSVIFEITRYVRPEFDFELSKISQCVNNIPFFTHVIFAIVSICFSLYSIWKAYIYSKNTINSSSIKEALESLPTGIAFISKNNELHLSNHIMHRICKELTSKDLMSGNNIWKDICDAKIIVNYALNDDKPTFMLKNGEVWQFSKTACKWQGDEYHEIKATNITELYNLSKNMENLNETLVNQQKRLEELTDIIEKNTEEQIAIDMKINFHDNFGNLLAITKQTLKETTKIEETKIIAEYWTKLTDIITDLANNEKRNLSLEQILFFGKKLGCEIVIDGELKADEENKNIMLLCINEALKNAYCHANADKLYVNIKNDEAMINMTIYNESKIQIPVIKEGGGLFGLRQKIEQSGGSFDIKTENGVEIVVKLVTRNEELGMKEEI